MKEPKLGICGQNTSTPGGCECPEKKGGARICCAWVTIMGGPMRPGSAIPSALFQLGQDTLSESSYTPQALNFVAGYAMKGVSHDVTAAGAPRRVTLPGD